MNFSSFTDLFIFLVKAVSWVSWGVCWGCFSVICPHTKDLHREHTLNCQNSPKQINKAEWAAFNSTNKDKSIMAVGGPAAGSPASLPPSFAGSNASPPTCSRFPWSSLGLLFKFLLQLALTALSLFAMSGWVLKQHWPPSCIFRANASQLIASSPDDPEKVRELLKVVGGS